MDEPGMNEWNASKWMNKSNKVYYRVEVPKQSRIRRIYVFSCFSSSVWYRKWQCMHTHTHTHTYTQCQNASHEIQRRQMDFRVFGMNILQRSKCCILIIPHIFGDAFFFSLCVSIRLTHSLEIKSMCARQLRANSRICLCISFWQFFFFWVCRLFWL